MNLSRILQIVRRASQASPREWSIRVQQWLHLQSLAWSARQGIPPYPENAHRACLAKTPWKSLQSWWNSQPTPPWITPERLTIPPHDSRLAASDHRVPLLLDESLSLFSRHPIRFRHPRRWHRDFILEKEAELSLFTEIPYLDADKVGDSKHTWEPNRWGWVYPLGAHYQLTQDPACFQRFRDWVLDWQSQNPYPFGINYCSALEQAFRGYAIRWAMELFREPLRDPKNAELFDVLCRILWIGAKHVEKNLSWYFAPNTHLIGEAFFLYVVGTSLPAWPESANWRDMGRQILMDEAHRQFHTDGTHRELSTCYHLYSTDFYLHALWVSEQSGNADPELESAALKMAKRLHELTPMSGILPPLHDCDGGRLTGFADRSLDARPSLLLAQQRWPQAFLCPSYWECRGDHQWLHFAPTPLACEITKEPNALETDSGIAVYKNDAGDYVLFRAGPFGYHDCPHSHDGQLETLVYLGGEPVVVDAGTGAYTQGAAVRNAYRLSQGKNAPLVNGQGPSEPADAFSWKRSTTGRLIHVESRSDGWSAVGAHDGYTASCGFPVEFQRSIHAYHVGVILVIDQWTSAQEIDISIPWTLSPHLTRHGSKWCSPTGSPLHIITLSDSLPRDKQTLHSLRSSNGVFSRDYGWNETTTVVSHRIPASSTGTCLTLFSRIADLRIDITQDHYTIQSVAQGFFLEWYPNKLSHEWLMLKSSPPTLRTPAESWGAN